MKVNWPLINSDQMYGGVYRGIAYKMTDETRVFIPSLSSNNPFNGSDVTAEEFEKNKLMFPKARWCSMPMWEIALQEPSSCWVAFENGDSKRPIILGYFGKGLEKAPGGGVSGYTSGNFVFPSDKGKNTHEWLVLHTGCTSDETVEYLVEILKANECSVHGAIGKEGTTQLAEWDSLQYHCGANDNSIGLEMLESRYLKWSNNCTQVTWDSSHDADVKTFHEAVYKNAVTIYAQLSNLFNVPIDHIISHKEASTKIGATAHGDPEELWDQFKKRWNDNKWTMDAFRKAVNEAKPNAGLPPVPISNSSTNITGEGATIIDKAVDWACKIANDNKYIYKWGGNGSDYSFDCSHFVFAAYHDSNAGGISNLSYAATGSMAEVYSKAGFKNVFSEVSPISSCSKLIKGDILVSSQHTAIYIGNGEIVHASTANAPIADQIKIGKYYVSSSNPWNAVLRYVK